MALYRLFSEGVAIQYKNTLCSKASFFILITTIVALAAPLVVAYRSRGFWLKNYVFYEQPEVHFKYKYLLVAQGEGGNMAMACGSMPGRLTNTMDDCFLVKVHEVDNTYDRKIDEIHLALKLSNTKLKKILSIKLFMILDYKLNGVCPLQMESLAIHEQEFGLPVSRHFITANLHLNQVAALPCWSHHRDIQFNDSVIPEDSTNDGDWLEEIIYSYSRRNVSTNLSNKYTVTKYGITPVIHIDISIAIPEHPIRYKPGLWQELKHSWQQYVTIAFIFYWFMNKIKLYVLKNEMLYTWKNVPWKKTF